MSTADPTGPTTPISLALSLEHPPYAQQVRLGPVDVMTLLLEDQNDPSDAKPLRIGIGRTVNITASNGQWNVLPDGDYLWTVAVMSDLAVGMRLHVTDCALPPGGQLRFIAASDVSRTEGPFRGSGPFGGGAFWSTILPGDEVYVELRCPGDTPSPPTSIPLVIDEVQHLYRDPIHGLPEMRAGPCHNDVTCFGAWSDLSYAVAGISFVGEGSLLCTGELLNTLAGDFTPYLITANHCIDTALAAQSMVVFWRYQTSACNGPPPDITSVPTSTAAELLASSPPWDLDYSLTMILGELPPGFYTWAGWNAGTVPDGTPCTCIHHPSGSYKRISFANKVSGAPPGFMRMDWYDGPTDDGSSGSGAHLDSTQQLIGVLSYGPSACPDESYDDFTAFGSFFPQIVSWLQGGSDDVFDENDTCATAAATPPSTYVGLVVKLADDDWYQIESSSCGPVDITLNFTDAFGDIDMALYDACGGALVGVSSGTGDTETLSIPAAAVGDFRLRVHLVGGVRNTYTMTVSAPAGGTAVYPIDAGSLAVPDNNATGVNHTFFVDDHMIIAGLKAAVTITHTWNGDIRAVLSHNGTSVTLIDRPGLPGSPFGFNNDGFDVLLDDGAFTSIESFDTGGPAVVGMFIPNEPLAAFDGQDAYGLWTLNVADLESLDTGTLDRWALHVPPLEPCACGGAGDVNGDQATDMADFAEFQQCFTGAGLGTPVGCQVFDFDCDGNVDLDDYSDFAAAITGPQSSTTSESPDPPDDGGSGGSTGAY